MRIKRKDARLVRPVVWACLLMSGWGALAGWLVLPATAVALVPSADFGDAPDGQTAGYSAPYANVVGKFPTLFATTNSRFNLPGGHTLDTSKEWLGTTVTVELGPNDHFTDPDGTENFIDDDFDDGIVGGICPSVTPSVPWPATLQATLSVKVTVAAGAEPGTRYVNLLMDLNHDGEWKLPEDPNNPGNPLPGGLTEWVVQDYAVNVPPGTSQTIVLGSFGVPLSSVPIWTRIALTRTPITGSFPDDGFGWDGSGAFSRGEIEDYLIENAFAHAAAAAQAAAHASAYAQSLSEAYSHAQAIESALAAVDVSTYVASASASASTASASASAASASAAAANASASAAAQSSAEASASATAVAAACASCACAEACAGASAGAQVSANAAATASASASAAAQAAAEAFSYATAQATAASSAHAQASAQASAVATAYAQAQAHSSALATAQANAGAAAASASAAAGTALSQACAGNARAAAAAAASAQSYAAAAASALTAVDTDAFTDAYAAADAHVAASVAAYAATTASTAASAAASAQASASSSATVAASASTSASASASAVASASTLVSASCTDLDNCCPHTCGRIADQDGDGYVNEIDIEIFIGCITGANVNVTVGQCLLADLDCDNDVDPADFGLLQRCYNGWIPMRPDCLEDPPQYTGSTISYLLELGGYNQSIQYENSLTYPSFLRGQPYDGQMFLAGQVLTYDVVVQTFGMHYYPGHPGDGFPPSGVANLAFSLELRKDSWSGPLVQIGHAHVVGGQPTMAGWFSTINDGDADGIRGTYMGPDPLANGAFTTSFNIYGYGMEGGRLFDMPSSGGPFLDVHSYPSAAGWPMEAEVLPGLLVGMGAGYQRYIPPSVGGHSIAGVGLPMTMFENSSSTAAGGLGIVPVSEGQINTEGLPAGTYVLRLVPEHGNNILRGDFNPEYESPWDFAAPANAVEGDTITFLLAPGQSAPVILSWKSERTHSGGAGDLSITLQSSGTPKTEPRRNGIRKILVDFDGPVQPADGNLDTGDVVVTDTNSIVYIPSAVSLLNDATVLSIEFTSGLPDQKRYLFELEGKFKALGAPFSMLTGDTNCEVRGLVGDVNNSGNNNLIDVGAVKSNSSSTVTASNCRFDLNTDGNINLIDVGLAKSKYGNTAP